LEKWWYFIIFCDKLAKKRAHFKIRSLFQKFEEFFMRKTLEGNNNEEL